MKRKQKKEREEDSKGKESYSRKVSKLKRKNQKK